MTLTTHAVAGAAVASVVPQSPAIGFILGFLSHFLLDSFPHGHYKVRSHTRHRDDPLSEDIIIGSKEFLQDILRISFDFALGLTLSLLIFAPSGSIYKWPILLGALAGTLPDALQLAYYKIRRGFLIPLQRFHIDVHARGNFNDSTWKMLAVEMLTIVICVAIAKFIGA